MFERGGRTLRNMLALALMFLMVLPVAPAGASGTAEGGDCGPRTVTDDSSNLIIPSGETYELYGCHTYSKSVQINGTLKVKPYDGTDANTGTLWLYAASISVGTCGTISADGRGYGGGGGASQKSGSGGLGGTAGKGGAGDSSSTCGGGGGGSNGGAGGNGMGNGLPGAPGTEAGGGDGGDVISAGNSGGAGGTGFGGGGGGGAGPGKTPSPGQPDAGGGGGGGTGGIPGSGLNLGGNGAGPAAGTGGSGQGVKGNEGGYASSGVNGDTTTDMTILRGSGGGGGTSGGGAAALQYYGGGGGGGAGGGSVALVSDGDITIGGTIASTGGGGGIGGQDAAGLGGIGGGGAGGGVLLFGQNVNVTGSMDARGRTGDTLSIVNGGTVKIFYLVDHFSSGTIQAGRKYTNGRPKMQGLLSPENNGQVLGKPKFEWNSAFDPESDLLLYQLQVSKTQDFKTLELNITDIVDKEYTAANSFKGAAFYWRARAADAIGYGPWSETWKFITDEIPPVSQVKPLPIYSTSVNFTVSWNGTDDSSGIEEYRIFVAEDEGSFLLWLDTSNNTGIFEGVEGHKYSFYSIASDKGGNIEADKSAAEAFTTVDSTPPISRLASMAAYQFKATFKVSWSGTDAVSGVRSYDVYSQADEGGFDNWQSRTDKTSADFTGEDGHAYAFYSIAIDNAGNVQRAPEDKDIVRVKIDLTAPVTSARVGDPNFGTGPAFVTPATNIYLDAEDSFSGMNGTFFIIDGRPSKPYGTGVKESAPGHHNMTYWSLDKAGNKGENGTLWFFVDNEAPVTTVSYDGPMANAGGKVFVMPQTAISVSTSDAGSGVNRTEYKLDSQAYKAYTEPLKLSTAGQHTILFRSSDKVGNSEAEKTLKVTVDTTPPVTKATASAQLSKEDIAVSLSATDADSGVSGTYHRVVKDKATPGDFQSGTDLVIEAKEDGSADGNYTIQYYSADMLGNKETVKELKVKMDTTVLLQLTNEGKQSVSQDRYTIEGKTEPGSNLTVGGEQVTLSANGSFSYEVSLKAGGNKITIQVTDPAGNTASKTVDITYNEPAAGAESQIPIIAIVVIACCAGAGAFLWMRKKKK
jgi:hypothetical protein